MNSRKLVSFLAGAAAAARASTEVGAGMEFPAAAAAASSPAGFWFGMLAVLFVFRSTSCSIDASRVLSAVSGSCLGTTVAEEESCDAGGAGAGAEAEAGAAAGGGGCEADESAMVVVLIVNEGEWW